MSKKIDLTGQKFGRLVVLRFLEKRKGRSFWVCRCECGMEREFDGYRLLHGRATGCGCQRGKAAKHGFFGTPTYKSWCQMIDRCVNPNHHAYKRYGGRGIAVCQEWRDSFESFFKDMGVRPDGKSIDRVDNNKGYSPDNCRWATPTEQQMNKDVKGYCYRPKTKKFESSITINGKYKYLGQFAKKEEARAAYDKAKKDQLRTVLQD